MCCVFRVCLCQQACVNDDMGADVTLSFSLRIVFGVLILMERFVCDFCFCIVFVFVFFFVNDCVPWYMIGDSRG